MARPRSAPSARRTDALVQMQERAPRVAAHFHATHGMVLSEQVMLLAAFFRGLDEEERAAARRLELAPAGITEWFDDGGLDRPLLPGLDARLHHRYACNPPEVVTILTGGADGLHFGMFHDDPAKPPWLTTQCFARDTGETTAFTGRNHTVLDGLYRRLKQSRAGDDGAILSRALDELGDAEEAVVAREHPRRGKTVTRLTTIAGVGPLLPPKMAHDPAWPSVAVRRAAYRANDPIIDRWMDQARASIEVPGLALMLGRDLFFLGADRMQDAVALQVAAYEVLGRPQLAEMVRLHAAHRDLRSVNVYAR